MKTQNLNTNKAMKSKEKMSKINLILLALVVCMIIPTVSAFDDIGYFKQNTSLNLFLGCSFNNTYCGSNFGCNISIYSPTSAVLVNNAKMDSTSYPQYNYTISGNSLSNYGQYLGSQICCGPVGCSTPYTFQFNVNPVGIQPNNNIGLLASIILIILIQVGLFLFLNNAFEKKRHGIKVLLILLSIALLILGAGFLKVIMSEQAGVDNATYNSLNNLATVNLVAMISVFSLFLIYFVITYIRALLKGVQDAKEEKEEFDWGV